MMKLDISAILIVKNEAERLTVLLPKLTGIFDEVLVINQDRHRSDNTVDVCNENNVKHTLDEDWGFCEPSKNLGPFLAKHEWCLSIDADEDPTPEFIAWLQTFDRSYDCYYIARKNFPLKERPQDIYPAIEYKLRLFRRGFVYCKPILHNDYDPRFDAKVGRIEFAALLHNKNFGEWQKDHNRYMDLIKRYKDSPIIPRQLKEKA